jgi:NADH:ubiquinone oxidoreductase subunit 6 (subunit J)
MNTFQIIVIALNIIAAMAMSYSMYKNGRKYYKERKYYRMIASMTCHLFLISLFISHFI